ncbi:hypothetical protein ABPG72_019879 [Tetrahymena utriculariae]
MAFNSKTSYQIYYEEQCKIYKQKGITGNEAAKLIGKQWSSLSPLEKKPYDDKKKEYEQQMQREQKVMKDFQKKSQQDNQQAKSNASSKNQNDEKQTSQQKQENIKKFMKEDLQKEKQDIHKKVVIKKVDSSGKVLSTNSQQPQTQINQSEKQRSSTQQQKNIQTDKAVGQKKQNNNNQNSQEMKVQKTKEEQKQFQMSSEQEKLRKSNHQIYIDFYRERLAFYQKRFPQRTAKELTQAVKEEWNCVKLQSKIQQKNKKKEVKQSKEVQAVQKEGKKIIEVNGQFLEIPLKPISGYLRYYKEVQHKLKLKNPDCAQNEIAKLASDQWNALPKDEQEQYNNQFHKEKLEYNKKINEIKQKYNIVPTDISQKKSKKSSKNFIIVNDQKVYYPLRLGGYFLYQRNAREQLSKQNHNRDSREISSLIGQTWKQMSQLEKQHYENQSEVEYQEQKRNFIEKYGKFPEQEAKIKQKPAEKIQKVEQSQSKKINEKRKAPTQKAQQEAWSQEKEEQFMKKYERKMIINYDDVESEIEDIYSDIEKDKKKKQVRIQQQDEIEEERDGIEGHGKYLNASREEQFEDIEKQSTKKKKVKTEKRSSSSVSNPGSVSKQTNRLYEMLKQPIQAPEDFEFQFS